MRLRRRGRSSSRAGASVPEWRWLDRGGDVRRRNPAEHERHGAGVEGSVQFGPTEEEDTGRIDRGNDGDLAVIVESDADPAQQRATIKASDGARRLLVHGMTSN